MSLKSLKRHEGWLMIDHRAGPGLPEHVALKAGYNPRECIGGRVFETATITCSHCGSAYAKNARRIRPRGYCKKCDHYLCDGCDAKMSKPDYVHVSFRQFAEASINAAMQGTSLDVASLSAPKIIVP